MKTFRKRGGTKASVGFTIANGKIAPGRAAFVRSRANASSHAGVILLTQFSASGFSCDTRIRTRGQQPKQIFRIPGFASREMLADHAARVVAISDISFPARLNLCGLLLNFQSN